MTQAENSLLLYELSYYSLSRSLSLISFQFVLIIKERKTVHVTGRGVLHKVMRRWDPTFLDNRQTDIIEVVSLTHRLIFNVDEDSCFLSEPESTPGPQRGWRNWAKLKQSMIPSGIEPAPFRLVVPQPSTISTDRIYWKKISLTLP